MTVDDEIAELLGPYALDAVDPDEARSVEEHLSGCPRCRAELARHREVAAMLGNAGGAAPEGIWERIAVELALEQPGGGGVRPSERTVGPSPVGPSPVGPSPVGPSPVGPSPVGNARPARRRALPLTLAGVGALAAALAVVVGLLSAKVSSLDHQVSQVEGSLGAPSVLSGALAAMLDPNDTQLELTSAPAPARPVARLVVDRSSGTAFFVGSGLRALPASRTYQLWSLVRHEPVSIALLGARPSATELHLEPGMSTFMVTAEPEGGTTRPTGRVVVQGTLPATS